MRSHITIVWYILFILSCTMCLLRFMCTLFVTLCFSDTNTPRPCSTNTIGARHSFPYPTAPQEPTVALLFCCSWWRYRKGPSKSAPASVAWYGQQNRSATVGSWGAVGYGKLCLAPIVLVLQGRGVFVSENHNVTNRVHMNRNKHIVQDSIKSMYHTIVIWLRTNANL